jgi:hypothetical protein
LKPALTNFEIEEAHRSFSTILRIHVQADENSVSRTFRADDYAGRRLPRGRSQKGAIAMLNHNTYDVV